MPSAAARKARRELVVAKSRRALPVWLPNPIDSAVLFVFEAAIVFVLALVSFAIAVLALWVF